jgi:hypothetical protein
MKSEADMQRSPEGGGAIQSGTKPTDSPDLDGYRCEVTIFNDFPVGSQIIVRRAAATFE